MIRILSILLLSFFITTSAFAKKEWQELKGDNFIIMYRLDVPQDFAQTVLGTAQDEFVRISNNLGITRYQNWRFDKRATIVIYSDEEDYVKNGGQYGWSHGAALVREKIIRTYPQAHGFFDSTLPHELGHIIFREIVGLYSVIPLWFEEGIAMNQEKAKRFGSDKQVRQYLEKGEFITLTDLSDMRLYSGTDEDKVHQFYAEAASSFSYLINEFGEQKLHRLLKELKENTPFDTALSKVYMRIKSTQDLNKWWVNFLKGNE